VVVEFETRDARAHGALLRAYETELARGRTALGAADVPPLVVHEHKAGLIVGYPAVIDTMLAMAELSEWAGKSACSIALGQGALSIESVLPVLSSMVAAQDNPGLRALVAEAQRRGLPLLWDDALVTVGTGRASVSFEIAKVPAVAAVPWDTLGRIPVALVTGTNGKTTSSRWLSHVCTAAGYGVGTTSTDGVIIRGVLHDEGDWTGPAGARVVLRSPEVDLAVLETARGGILRRGLAVDDVHAALITNVSADHFGAYGIDDVPGMVRAKGVVAHAVRSDGAVVLNAGDQGLVALSNSVRGNVVFFADVDGGANKGAAVAEAHVAAGGTAWLAKEGRIVRASPQGSQDIAAVNALPLTFGGRARYNVENALGVAAVAHALGVSDTNIAKSLGTFGMAQNPGRGQLVTVDGVRVLIDFGHNPEGVRGLLDLVAGLRSDTGGQLFVITGAAGDRSNGDIFSLCEVLLKAAPAKILVRELGGYLRGRAPGEVPQAFLRALEAQGYPTASVSIAASEVDALRDCLTLARRGDVVTLLVHVDRNDVASFLASRATPET
jgi:cyanophycin synthetase